MEAASFMKMTTEAAELLSAMGNRRRLLIFLYLLEGEKGVGALVGKIGISQSALSQHLGILRYHRLVKTRKEKQFVYYSLSDEKVIAVIKTLDEIYENTPVLTVPEGAIKLSNPRV